MEPLLVISSYPAKGETHARKFVGIASYTKNLLSNMPGSKTVLAEAMENEESYNEGDVQVKRVWKRNSPFAFYFLLKNIASSGESRTILFEFEHAMFGGILSLIPLPFFIFMAEKFFNKRVIFVFHQVIGDINNLHGQLNIKKRGLKAFLLNPMIHLFYKLILLGVTKAVVFEEELKLNLGNNSKVIVIPHGVEEFGKEVSQNEAKKRLGLLGKSVILSFGFLAWYKGSDFIVEQFKDMPKNYKLILAGGPNPNHVGKKYYDKYIESVQNEAKKNNVTVTGFVPEDQIVLYFNAADLVVFPYRNLMSSSGPLSLCFSFKKPFLLSRPLTNILKTKDFEETLKKLGLNKRDLTFSLQGNDLRKSIKKAIRGNLRQTLIEFTRLIARERRFKNISESYEKIIKSDEEFIESASPVLGVERA